MLLPSSKPSVGFFWGEEEGLSLEVPQGSGTTGTRGKESGKSAQSCVFPFLFFF